MTTTRQCVTVISNHSIALSVMALMDDNVVEVCGNRAVCMKEISEIRDVEGIENVPIARGVPLPHRLGGLESVVSSPAGCAMGRVPAANAFSSLFECHRTLWVKRKRNTSA